MIAAPTARAPVPGVEVELGGTTYIVPPLSLGAIEFLQKRLSTYIENGVMHPESVGTMIDAARMALRRNYPDLGREWVAQARADLEAEGEEVADLRALLEGPADRAFLAANIDVGTMQAVFEAVMDVGGMKRREQQAGKAQAATSTGAASTPT
jgi:hypothetical protein